LHVQYELMSAPVLTKPKDTPAPPEVSGLIRTLCAPWMWCKRIFHRARLSQRVTERVLGREFTIEPGVLNPVAFRAGRYFAEFIAQTPRLAFDISPARPTALDIGTGCGILGVFAAFRGYGVTAIDIEPGAVACARANAKRNGVEKQMRVIEGDLFSPVEGEVFDIVMFNLPFFRGTAQTPFESAWRSPDVIERCAAGLPAVLAKGGSAYFVLSSHGDPRGMLAALSRAGLMVERLTWKHFGVETLAIYSARYICHDE
jgi:release factor glutamine methyltransferase